MASKKKRIGSHKKLTGKTISKLHQLLKGNGITSRVQNRSKIRGWHQLTVENPDLIEQAKTIAEKNGFTVTVTVKGLSIPNPDKVTKKVTKKPAKKAAQKAEKPIAKKSTKKPSITKTEARFRKGNTRKKTVATMAVEEAAFVNLLKGVQVRRLENVISKLMDSMDTPTQKSFAKVFAKKAGLTNGAVTPEQKKLISAGRKLQKMAKSLN